MVTLYAVCSYKGLTGQFTLNQRKHENDPIFQPPTLNAFVDNWHLATAKSAFPLLARVFWGL